MYHVDNVKIMLLTHQLIPKDKWVTCHLTTELYYSEQNFVLCRFVLKSIKRLLDKRIQGHSTCIKRSSWNLDVLSDGIVR